MPAIGHLAADAAATRPTLRPSRSAIRPFLAPTVLEWLVSQVTTETEKPLARPCRALHKRDETPLDESMQAVFEVRRDQVRSASHAGSWQVLEIGSQKIRCRYGNERRGEQSKTG